MQKRKEIINLLVGLFSIVLQSIYLKRVLWVSSVSLFPLPLSLRDYLHLDYIVPRAFTSYRAECFLRSFEASSLSPWKTPFFFFLIIVEVSLHPLSLVLLPGT